MNLAFRPILTALLIMSVTGCASVLAPRPERSKFYLLSASAPSGAAGRGAPSANAPVVGVGPVHIPDYLQRPEIATRVDRSQVLYSGGNRWAEPLEKCFPRVLAEDLANQLSSDEVVLFPWPGNIRVDYQVQLYVERFELTSQNRAVLAARWLIDEPQDGRILASGDTNDIVSAGTDAASGTAALSRAVAAMSERIGSHIIELSLAAQRAPR